MTVARGAAAVRACARAVPSASAVADAGAEPSAGTSKPDATTALTDFNPTLTIAARGTVVEVKDTAQLAASPQLRDLVGYAQGQSVPLEIFTNASLPSSGELFNWIQSGQVVISPIP